MLVLMKWSLGHKTYIEKTLFGGGINVNNCNILCFALRIASRSPQLCLHQFFILLRKPPARCCVSQNYDPMMDSIAVHITLSLPSWLTFHDRRGNFSASAFCFCLQTEHVKINAIHFLIVIVTNEQQTQARWVHHC